MAEISGGSPLGEAELASYSSPPGTSWEQVPDPQNLKPGQLVLAHYVKYDENSPPKIIQGIVASIRPPVSDTPNSVGYVHVGSSGSNTESHVLPMGRRNLLLSEQKPPKPPFRVVIEECTFFRPKQRLAVSEVPTAIIP